MLNIAYLGYYGVPEKACGYLGEIRDIRDFDKKNFLEVYIYLHANSNLAFQLACLLV